MDNYPPLLHNVLSHLRTEIAKKSFLWSVDTWDKSRMKYPSEDYACEVDKLVLFLKPTLKHSAEQLPLNADSEVMDDLLRFILRRHLVYRLGEQKAYWV